MEGIPKFSGKEVFALGSQVTGIDLVKLCHETKEEELNRQIMRSLRFYRVDGDFRCWKKNFPYRIFMRVFAGNTAHYVPPGC